MTGSMSVAKISAGRRSSPSAAMAVWAVIRNSPLASVISAGRGMMSMLRAEPAAARSVTKINKMLFLIGLGKGGG